MVRGANYIQSQCRMHSLGRRLDWHEAVLGRHNVTMPGTIVSMTALPSNFEQFADEMAEGIGVLYGARAGRDFLGRSRGMLSGHLAHPAVLAAGHFEGEECRAMGMASLRGAEGNIFLMHVLHPWQGMGIESGLARTLCAGLRARDARRILCEMVPLCALDLASVMAEEGFRCVPRLLLHASLTCSGLTAAPLEEGIALGPRHWHAAAACLVDAYVGHAGRLLHAELRSEAAAVETIARVAAGCYGTVQHGFLRAFIQGGQCSGVVLGTIAAAETGFVLQLAVRRAKQGHGLGTDLLRGLAAAFRRAGLRDVALGVTRGNPAERLYRRLGFEVLREVNAYVWEQTG